jgi:hypothetical protein
MKYIFYNNLGQKSSISREIYGATPATHQGPMAAFSKNLLPVGAFCSYYN